MEFTCSRLKIARQRRGLTKKELAEAVGACEKSVQEWENGHTIPLVEHVEALAIVLRFPVTFFAQPEIEAPHPDTASFRSMKAMTASQRDMALSSGALCLELSRWIDERFRLPEPALPDLRGVTPEAAAAELRDSWGLGLRPVKNMIHLMELHGVRVFSLVQDNVEVDAFSLRLGELPFVFLNSQKSSERSRFDAAHELGHLVLHRHGEPTGRSAEQEADEFASAFLMPRETVLVNAPRLPTRENLIALKKIWGVSVRALINRLFRLGLISEWHYRKFFIENQDTRTVEPNSIARERSQTLERVFDALSKEGVGKAEVARSLHIQSLDLETVIFGLTAVSSERSPQPPGGNERKPRQTKLRLA